MRAGDVLKRILSADDKPICFSKNENVASPEALCKSHCHYSYELLFVMEGEGLFVVEGKEYLLSARSVMITKPLEYHYVKINPDVKYERYLVRFNDADLREDTATVLEELLGSEGEPRSFSFPGMIGDAIVSIYERSQIAASLPKQHAAAYSRILLSELILLFSIANKESNVSYDGDISVRVIKYINEHLHRSRQMSLDFLAQRFFVSKYYLCRVFKKHNGISIHGYIVQKRIMQAKILIESGEQATTAARKVGFRDYSAFYRAFLKTVGVPPTDSIMNKENGNLEV